MKRTLLPLPPFPPGVKVEFPRQTPILKPGSEILLAFEGFITFELDCGDGHTLHCNVDPDNRHLTVCLINTKPRSGTALWEQRIRPSRKLFFGSAPSTEGVIWWMDHNAGRIYAARCFPGQVTKLSKPLPVLGEPDWVGQTALSSQRHLAWQPRHSVGRTS